MKRFNTGIVYAAIAGVLALAAISYLDSNSESTRLTAIAERFAAMEAAVNTIAAQPIEERIIELPEDGNAWYTTIISPEKTVKNDPIARKLEANLKVNPRLASLIAQTHVNRYHPSHPMWNAKYRPIYGDNPPTAIVVQTPDGKVCYKATGANIPSDGDALADSIARAIADCRPRPNPSPTPTPDPTPPVIPDTVPDIGPDESATTEENLAALLILMGIAGLGGGFIQGRKTGAA